jgi:hypothetical protein
MDLRHYSGYLMILSVYLKLYSINDKINEYGSAGGMRIAMWSGST